ncbi:DUF4160 domain-containing protein [Flavilitoribacter nigricans]|uniref:DUF4160 domain-containing protein n=1 Tax=Flavilitoribacter nigricans (strain ATCC 23147 / DSM 23189 / NBRC 102662 / NCIMB 1420 / SS-2) TaxID=1122177 RepID=A0A2D0NFH6_FLAN2|nr:DUF4160 domain-containing protein [Flavilitoribacter nigricans]PHN07140.1 hypothetical protein CRP01_07895 [Flavilitoribacter nigricans DSM 23189 = NBRC 102662]
MPTIKIIDSIKILMYFNDHLPPHFHAIYNEYEVLIEIRSLKVYAGKLPKSQMKKVLDWAGSNQEFLMKKWTEFNPNS